MTSTSALRFVIATLALPLQLLLQCCSVAAVTLPAHEAGNAAKLAASQPTPAEKAAEPGNAEVDGLRQRGEEVDDQVALEDVANYVHRKPSLMRKEQADQPGNLTEDMAKALRKGNFAFKASKPPPEVFHCGNHDGTVPVPASIGQCFCGTGKGAPICVSTVTKYCYIQELKAQSEAEDATEETVGECHSDKVEACPDGNRRVASTKFCKCGSSAELCDPDRLPYCELSSSTCSSERNITNGAGELDVDLNDSATDALLRDFGVSANETNRTSLNLSRDDTDGSTVLLNESSKAHGNQSSPSMAKKAQGNSSNPTRTTPV